MATPVHPGVAAGRDALAWDLEPGHACVVSGRGSTGDEHVVAVFCPKKLFDDWNIRPLIDTRQLWRDEKKEPGYDPTKPITRAFYTDRADTITYREKGQMGCECPETGTKRDLAFHGFENDRGTLKYRCPAAAYGMDCVGRAACEAAAGVPSNGYGRIIRGPA